MSVKVLYDKATGYKCLYCDVTMMAFGDVFYHHECPDEFLEWLNFGANGLPPEILSEKVEEWREEQSQKEIFNT